MIFGKSPRFPADDVPGVPTQPYMPPEQSQGLLAGYLDKPMGKPNVFGIILDAIAGAGGAAPTYGLGRQRQMEEQRQAKKSMLAQLLEDRQWQQRQEYQRANPAPFRFESNSGDQMEIGPDGQPRTLYKDPTPKIDWIQVKDPATGAISIVPRPQGAAPVSPPPGVTFKPRAGGAGSQAPRTFPIR